jgi:hypothetical protein
LDVELVLLPVEEVVLVFVVELMVLLLEFEVELALELFAKKDELEIEVRRKSQVSMSGSSVHIMKVTCWGVFSLK